MVVVTISFIDAVHFAPLFLWSVFIVHGTIQWGGPKKLGASATGILLARTSREVCGRSKGLCPYGEQKKGLKFG